MRRSAGSGLTPPFGGRGQLRVLPTVQFGRRDLGLHSDIARDALHPAERIDAYIAAEGEMGAAIGIASEVLA